MYSRKLSLQNRLLSTLTNTPGDAAAWWNHPLWARSNKKPKPEMLFVRIQPVLSDGKLKKSNNTGEEILASFDNHFVHVINGKRVDDGSYLFSFNSKTDRARFDADTMTLEFESGNTWFPLFQEAICISKHSVNTTNDKNNDEVSTSLTEKKNTGIQTQTQTAIIANEPGAPNNEIETKATITTTRTRDLDSAQPTWKLDLSSAVVQIPTPAAVAMVILILILLFRTRNRNRF